jgi:hypothetical protein
MKLLPKVTRGGAILAGIAAIVTIAAATRADAGWCSGWMNQYCVVSRDGVEYVAWTKPCFARQEGLHILHPGLCHGIDKRGRVY